MFRTRIPSPEEHPRCRLRYPRLLTLTSTLTSVLTLNSAAIVQLFVLVQVQMAILTAILILAIRGSANFVQRGFLVMMITRLQIRPRDIRPAAGGHVGLFEAAMMAGLGQIGAVGGQIGSRHYWARICKKCVKNDVIS